MHFQISGKVSQSAARAEQMNFWTVDEFKQFIALTLKMTHFIISFSTYCTIQEYDKEKC